MRILILIAVIAGFNSAGRAYEVKREFDLVDKNDAPGCAGLANGDCQRVCIYHKGTDEKGSYNKEKQCMEAHNLNTPERKMDYSKRRDSLLKKMNSPGFEGYTAADKDFYQYANRIDPQDQGEGQTGGDRQPASVSRANQ